MYNLDLQSYSLPDLLKLFELREDFSIQDLQQAKRIVLRMHPDKSGLPSEFFIFYKKAFELLVEMYDSMQKLNASVPTESPEYHTDNVNQVPLEKFQECFHALFETHVQKKKRTNDWFSDTSSGFRTESTDANSAIDAIKNNFLVQHREVQTINRNGSSFYEEDPELEEYVSSDLFASLKYDDLRKVHKDQTIFPSGHTMPSTTTVEMQKNERNSTLAPIARKEAERYFANREEASNNRWLEKQYNSKLKDMEIDAKNKEIMASFLLLR